MLALTLLHLKHGRRFADAVQICATPRQCIVKTLDIVGIRQLPIITLYNSFDESSQMVLTPRDTDVIMLMHAVHLDAPPVRFYYNWRGTSSNAMHDMHIRRVRSGKTAAIGRGVPPPR